MFSLEFLTCQSNPSSLNEKTQSFTTPLLISLLRNQCKKNLSKNIKYGTPYPPLYLGYIYTVHSFWLYERYASSAILIILVINFACSIIIASGTPGWVTIFLHRADGTKLGETQIWYYDEDKEASSEMSSNRNTITASGTEAQNSGIYGECRIIDCI